MSAPTYISIDLKSFYASVECVERQLDPMNVNLVVADAARSEKTICLAVTPPLKQYGVPGRARLFEVAQKIKAHNARRQSENGGKLLSEASVYNDLLQQHKAWAVDYIVAPPRMALYLEYSTRIYDIYTQYIAPEDIHVYSIDEVFIDAGAYLHTYQMTAVQLAKRMILDIFVNTGITATAGVGTNLYLAKIAMDIMAKRIAPDEDGVRIATLDEASYRHHLWQHQPLTDFWRVGQGYAKKLAAHGLMTMEDISRCSLGGPQDFHNEDLLYKLFGINAELLIDHAWGQETCTMADIKAYQPAATSTCSGQVLSRPYSFLEARLVVREMVELMVLSLVEKKQVTNHITLHVGYDRESLATGPQQAAYQGAVKVDFYGRTVPKSAHGSTSFEQHTSSTKVIVAAVLALYDEIVATALLVRRITLSADDILAEHHVRLKDNFQQMDLFSMLSTSQEQPAAPKSVACEREKRLQAAQLQIQQRFGKNALLKGSSLEEAATTRQRNEQIGGHKA